MFNKKSNNRNKRSVEVTYKILIWLLLFPKIKYLLWTLTWAELCHDVKKQLQKFTHQWNTKNIIYIKTSQFTTECSKYTKVLGHWQTIISYAFFSSKQLQNDKDWEPLWDAALCIWRILENLKIRDWRMVRCLLSSYIGVSYKNTQRNIFLCSTAISNTSKASEPTSS